MNRSARGLAVLGVALVVAGLALAGCGGSGGRPAASATSPGAASTTNSAHGGHAVAAVPPPAPLRPGESFATIRMPEPYTPVAPNGGTDEYRCFLVDPHLTSMAYLTGSQFLPQNTAIVHHAIFFRVSPGDAARARATDAADPGEGWTCFGDAGIGADAPWVALWAPGANETLFNQRIGFPMPPGSLLIMQVHYNLLASGGKAGGSDQSSIRLRLSDGRGGMQGLAVGELPAPVELPCPAGVSGPLCNRDAAVADVLHRFGSDVADTISGLNQQCNGGRPPVPGPTQHCQRTLPVGGTIYGVLGHMHLLGRSIRIDLNPGTPQAKTLLDVKNFNFDDQELHILPRPVTVKPGDTVRVTCTHDAGLHQLLPQLRNLPPRYVVWGDGTSDEMCLGLMLWVPQGQQG